MTKYLYPIFQTSGKNGCSDLTIALAMFLSDARLGKQQYGLPEKEQRVATNFIR